MFGERALTFSATISSFLPLCIPPLHLNFGRAVCMWINNQCYGSVLGSLLLLHFNTFLVIAHLTDYFQLIQDFTRKQRVEFIDVPQTLILTAFFFLYITFDSKLQLSPSTLIFCMYFSILLLHIYLLIFKFIMGLFSFLCTIRLQCV